MNTSKSLCCYLLILAIATIWCPKASAQPYSEIVAFGASLTDAGNISDLSRPILGFAALPSPYYEHRSSNGPIWTDILADRLRIPRPQASRLGGTNYAYGAATSGTIDNEIRHLGLLDMDDQVAQYLSRHSPTGKELIVIPGWISTSDFANGQDDPATTVAMVGSLVSDLATSGAQHILVGNSIDSPRFSRPELLRPYNDMLADELAVLRSTYPGVTFHEFDAEAVFDAILDDPAALGIVNLTDAACGDCGVGRNPNPIQVADNPNEFLFWDDISHFTAPIHEALGTAAFEAVPEPSAVILCVLGLFCAMSLRPFRKV